MARSAAAIQLEIDEVRTAMSAVRTGGQEIEVDDQRLKRASLSDLRKDLDALNRELARANGGTVGQIFSGN